MYLTISFKGITKFKKDIHLYAFKTKIYDDNNHEYYIYITDEKPIDNYDICSKIPNEFFGKLEKYGLIISSKEGSNNLSKENIEFTDK